MNNKTFKKRQEEQTLPYTCFECGNSIEEEKKSNHFMEQDKYIIICDDCLHEDLLKLKEKRLKINP
jgi:DNA-directed RNA polymerase subunit RPC12/RpoP